MATDSLRLQVRFATSKFKPHAPHFASSILSPSKELTLDLFDLLTVTTIYIIYLANR